MKVKTSTFFLLSLLLGLFIVSTVHAKGVAVTPTDKPDKWWVDRHAANVAHMEKGDIDLLMIGDSITHGWDGAVWDNYYKNRKAINLGFSGDRTEHVLWRLDHLPFEKISPKAAVIMIGTNNVGHNSTTPVETADGVKAIVEKLEKTFPKMKIIVLNVFPRGAKPEDGMRKKVDEINSYLPELLKGKENVKLLDINHIFLDADKNLPKEIMPDALHPKTKGYEMWAEALDPTLSEALGEKNPAIEPEDKLGTKRKEKDGKENTWWKDRHEANVAQMEKGDIEFLMIGDSITHGWDSQKTLVEKYFAQYKPINLGFGGDRTQHVLWRLDHLPMNKITPKVAMLMIGTNNIGDPRNTPWMIGVGIKAIVEKLHKQHPHMKIIVLSVFPRGEQPNDPRRIRVNEINLTLPKLLAGMKNVELVDIGPKFLDEKGVLSKEIMPDALHPNGKGYQIWADAVEPILKEKFGK